MKCPNLLYKPSIIWLLLLVLFINNLEGNKRRKRDDGSFAQDFGGPVAQAPGPEEPDQTELKPTPEPQVPSNECKWKNAPKQVLASIDFSKRTRKDNEPGTTADLETVDNYNFISTAVCDLALCFQMCRSIPTCNYIVRSPKSFTTYMIRVDSKLLVDNNFIVSNEYDSYGLICKQGDVDKGPVLEPNPLLSYLPVNTPPGAVSSDEGCVRMFSEPEKIKKFQTFISLFNKTYPDEGQRNEAYRKFSDNLQILQKINCNGVNNSSITKINRFGDILSQEFAQTHSGGLFNIGRSPFSMENDENGLTAMGKLGRTLITQCPKFSWVDQGVIPDVRDQKSCSSSFAFSAADLLSAQYQIDNGVKDANLFLSTQHILDCMSVPASAGCSGGRPLEVLRNLAFCVTPGGCSLPLESCYPYQGVQGSCQQKPCQDNKKLTVHWSIILNTDGNLEKEIIAAILHYGPAVVNIGTGVAWQFYSGKGILKPEQCFANEYHNALLVGYDFSGPVPFYVLKNSWGKDWGDNGYIKLEAGKNTCNVAQSLVVTCTRNCGTFKSTADILALRNTEQCALKARSPAAKAPGSSPPGFPAKKEQFPIPTVGYQSFV